MPGNEAHSKRTYEKYGVYASDLHSWMDKPSEWAGSLHRFYRHDPGSPPRWAVEKYGYDLASDIIQDHIQLDKYEDYNEKLIDYLTAITVKEKRSNNDPRSRAVRGTISDAHDDMMIVDCSHDRFKEGDSVGYLADRGEVIPLGEVFLGGKTLGIRNVNLAYRLQGKTLDLIEVENNICYDVQLRTLDKIRKNDLEEHQKNLTKHLYYRRYEQPISRKPLWDYRTLDDAYFLDSSQKNVLESILALGDGEVLIVVGPPGTGKTEVIAKAAYELSRKGERVLVTSHTKRAVDNIIKKLPVEHTLRVGRTSSILREARKYSLGEKSKKEAGATLEQIDNDIEALLEYLKELQAIKIGEADALNPGKHREEIKRVRTRVKELIVYRDALVKRERNSLISSSKIIGATLIRSALAPIDNIVFDTVFIDECSQVSIPLALLGMMKAKKWILIGDHKQLLPIYRALGPKQKEEARAMSAFCFFKEKYSCRVLWLQSHYRSNRDIIGFSSRYVYDDKVYASETCNGIRLGEEFSQTQGYLHPERAVVFMDVNGVEAGSGSKSNEQEASAVAQIVGDIGETGFNLRNVGVITTYLSQRNMLKQKMPRQVEVNTVDSFQGREKDIIIYSVVCTKNLDFVEDENRLNVAFTRARRKLIVVGNAEAIMRASPRGLLSKYVAYAHQRDGYFEYSGHDQLLLRSQNVPYEPVSSEAPSLRKGNSSSLKNTLDNS